MSCVLEEDKMQKKAKKFNRKLKDWVQHQQNMEGTSKQCKPVSLYTFVQNYVGSR